MTKTEKLLARIRNNPKNVHFDDLVNLLLRFGFAMRRNSGSHAVFSYPGYPPITIPKPHGSSCVKEVYVIKVFLPAIEAIGIREEFENAREDD